MDSWTSQSNSDKQTVLSVACSVAGLVLAIAFRDFSSSGGNARAGFLLGVLLLLIGVAGLLVSGKQTVIVDPRARRVTVKDSYLFGTKERSIPFGDVVAVSIGYLGKKSNLLLARLPVLIGFKEREARAALERIKSPMLALYYAEHDTVMGNTHSMLAVVHAIGLLREVSPADFSSSHPWRFDWDKPELFCCELLRRELKCPAA